MYPEVPLTTEWVAWSHCLKAWGTAGQHTLNNYYPACQEAGHITWQGIHKCVTEVKHPFCHFKICSLFVYSRLHLKICVAFCCLLCGRGAAVYIYTAHVCFQYSFCIWVTVKRVKYILEWELKMTLASVSSLSLPIWAELMLTVRSFSHFSSLGLFHATQGQPYLAQQGWRISGDIVVWSQPKSQSLQPVHSIRSCAPAVRPESFRISERASIQRGRRHRARGLFSATAWTEFTKPELFLSPEMKQHKTNLKKRKRSDVW